MNRTIVHQRAVSSASVGASAFQHARLLQSAASASQFPADEGVEVAIAGRSNAGKSSAINAITARRGLARISKQPGRTRLLNFFEIWPSARLVDLPGYGYAEGARAERSTWAELIEALARRGALRGVLLLVDARRGVQDSDAALLEWARQHEHAVHVLLSKADQLSRSEARGCLASARALLERAATVQLFSAREGSGVDEARDRLGQWLLHPKKSPGSPE